MDRISSLGVKNCLSPTAELEFEIDDNVDNWDNKFNTLLLEDPVLILKNTTWHLENLIHNWNIQISNKKYHNNELSNNSNL